MHVELNVFRPIRSFDIDLAIQVHTQIVLSDNVDYNYSVITPFVLHNEDEFDLIDWSSELRTPPTWTELLFAYGIYDNIIYPAVPVTFTHLHTIMNEINSKASIASVDDIINDMGLVIDEMDLKADVSAMTTALSGKASTAALATDVANLSALATTVAGKAAASHSHAMGDITGLVAALALKLETSTSNLLIKELSGTTDANGEVSFGISGFSSVVFTDAVIHDGSGNPIQGGFDVVKTFTASNVAFRFMSGKNQTVLLTGAFDTTRNTPTGYTVKAIVIGVKA